MAGLVIGNSFLFTELALGLLPELTEATEERRIAFGRGVRILQGPTAWIAPEIDVTALYLVVVVVVVEVT